MKNINRSLILILAFYTSICFGQKSYIRSSLPIRKGMVINPDNGRPFSDSAVDYFDNGRIKIKGRYSGGYASGYWSYFYPCLLYTSPSPRDQRGSRMPSSA